MRLTDKHISINELDALIITAELRLKESGLNWYKCILKAALELKHRRAKDRIKKA